MEPIKLTEGLRVVDYDASQYAIEKKFISEKGVITWKPIDYIMMVKHLATVAKKRIGEEAADKARTRAEEGFDASPLPKLLSNLPAKPEKAKKKAPTLEEPTPF